MKFCSLHCCSTAKSFYEYLFYINNCCYCGVKVVFLSTVPCTQLFCFLNFLWFSLITLDNCNRTKRILNFSFLIIKKYRSIVLKIYFIYTLSCLLWFFIRFGKTKYKRSLLKSFHELMIFFIQSFNAAS